MVQEYAHEAGETQELRAMEGLRLDELHAAHWSKAIAGDLEATAAVLDIMDRRARLFGLNLNGDVDEAEDESDDDLDAFLAEKLGSNRGQGRAELERRLRQFAVDEGRAND